MGFRTGSIPRAFGFLGVEQGIFFSFLLSFFPFFFFLTECSMVDCRALLLAAVQESPAGGPAQHIPGSGRGTRECFWEVL